MHILIIEDEIPAFEKLRMLLAKYFEGKFTYDWARSKSEMLYYFNSESKYDLIFSDIQLLDGLSFDVFENSPITTPIVFCTAFDEYLLKAFQSNGIAYILKPYGEDEIKAVFDKYELLFNRGNDINMSIKVINEIKSLFKNKPGSYKSQFVIKTNKGIQLLDVESISLIEAKGDFCKIVDLNGKVYLYSQNIGKVFSLLDPHQFFRINRSQVIHIKYIKHIENHFKNRLLISIQGVSEKIKTSSSTTADFRTWLDR